MAFNSLIKISDFDYGLPDERIAKFPLAERDSSKLLVYRGGKTSVCENTSGAVEMAAGGTFCRDISVHAASVKDSANTSPAGEISDQNSCPTTREISGYSTCHTIKEIYSPNSCPTAGEISDHNTCSAAGEISETVFRNIGEVLPRGAMLVFNNTKVIRARLIMHKPSGARIEVFCLEPHAPADYERAFSVAGRCEWLCIVGGLKKWKTGALEIPFDYESLSYKLLAYNTGTHGRENIIRFEWDAPLTFGQLLEHLGKIPIPPYLGRESEESDNERYQTVYSRFEGSVAAPTAGLHFTPELIEQLNKDDFTFGEITLHVGAGTFLPVKEQEAARHVMHTEHFEITRPFLEQLIANHNHIIPVGTTSVRTLESLPALGYRIMHGGNPCLGADRQDKWSADVMAGINVDNTETDTRADATVSDLADETIGNAAGVVVDKSAGVIVDKVIGQWEVYDIPAEITGKELLEALLQWMRARGVEKLKAATRIMIMPGFRYRIIEGMITNFHQPGSTLLLLVSAFVDGAGDLVSGEKRACEKEPHNSKYQGQGGAAQSSNWRRIYDYALQNGFRFLSYGDSSLLLK